MVVVIPKSVIGQLRQTIQDLKDPPIYQDIIEPKEGVFERFQPMFAEKNVKQITKDEFRNFLLLENNRHWSGLHRRVLKEYLGYYHRSRTHLGLDKDCPETRAFEQQSLGPIHSEPVLGGLHHRYTRRAA